MPGVSIHVVDVSRGLVAAGMKVELMRNGSPIAVGETSDKGLLEVRETLTQDLYDAVFYVADWYRGQGVKLPEVPFLDVVTFRFGIDDPKQHYHLPFKCTPWGYSCFRGGA
jgi:5-hydroxyisourate hydrolase